MRVLIVLAHKNNARGKLLGDRFVKFVRGAFHDCPEFQDRLDVLVRSYSQLGEFIPPVAAENEVPDIVRVRDRLSCLDGIDFVFLDGDDNLLPWAAPAAPLLQLMHLCLISGKFMFGSGCAVQLLAYLVNVGPVQVPVLNGAGKDGALRSFRSTANADRHGHIGLTRRSSDAAASITPPGLLLERQTGDLFHFDPKRAAWSPVGNVGIHCSLGAVAADAGASTGLNRSDGVGYCELSQSSRFHSLFKNVWPTKLLVPQTNEWHCHLPTFGAAIQLPTGHFDVHILASSQLGVQVAECRNAVGVQFRPDAKFPHTVRILQNFVASKVALGIGEAVGDMPVRLLEIAATDPQYSDIVQQVLRSLAPAPAGPFATALRQPASAPATSRTTTVADGAQGRPSTSRPSSAASAPSFRNSASRRAICSNVRPSSAHSDVASCSVGASAVASTHQENPKAALSYLRHSRDPLKTHAEAVHVGRTKKAFVEMPGVAHDVPIYTTKPPRASSAGSTRSFANELVARVYGTEMMIGALSEPPPPPPPPLSAGEASAHDVPKPERIVHIRQPSGRPFSNYQKYEAKAQALKGHSVHVTSVGPYVSKLDKINLDEQDRRHKSIHKNNFKPGGLWDKCEPHCPRTLRPASCI